jgi:putative methyltransferase (TIGR04325 family)
MNKKIKRIIKRSIPPIILDNIISRILFPQSKANPVWTGNYHTWKEASEQCTGYDSNTIFEKVKFALLKVKNHEAIYERDSVLFEKIEYSFPLLSGLMWIAAQNDGKLNIIDFGGSLGSTYFQNRLFLRDLNEVKWNIVEQPKFVEIGNREFETEQLRFFPTIESCLITQKSKTLILSSVLQYLEAPYQFLETVISFNFEYIVFDKTSFIENSNDIVTVQNVPEVIYEASYPVWFLNYNHFMEYLCSYYDLITDFDDNINYKILLDNKMCFWKGFIFKKKKNNG